MSRTPIGTTRRTGEKCPESGVWESQDGYSDEIPLSKNETFPPNRKKAVTWKLIRYA
ncbi:hypothetical protein [Winogradskyella sp. 3972H.M.0a.05]|uniref:hypothetical protein n=1 Tax=Winogradskyella sp. 3972H.M.0a.05 TaxID=2950277 RepID=UPI0033942C84